MDENEQGRQEGPAGQEGSACGPREEGESPSAPARASGVPSAAAALGCPSGVPSAAAALGCPSGGGAPPAVEHEGQEGAPTRASAELKAILEAMIFASPEPLTPKAIYKLLNDETSEDLQAALAELKRDYGRPGGLQLVEVAGGYQIVTRPDLHEWVRRLFHERAAQRLSVPALETLAVIAYKQPITALEITEIRGVNAAGVLNTLLERHLIKIIGRKQVVGRPFLYATTKEFLIRFGLNDLNELPKVEDMAEALGFEPPLLVEQHPPEDMLPLAEPDDDRPPDANPDGPVH